MAPDGAVHFQVNSLITFYWIEIFRLLQKPVEETIAESM